MTKREIRQAKWFGLVVVAFAVMCTAGTVWMWLLPLCVAAMAACVVRGELWDASPETEKKEAPRAGRRTTYKKSYFSDSISHSGGFVKGGKEK